MKKTMEYTMDARRVSELIKSRENDVGTPILLLIISVLIFIYSSDAFLYIIGAFFTVLFLLSSSTEYSKYFSCLDEYYLGEIENFLKVYPEWKKEFENINVSELKYKDLHRLYKKLEKIILTKAKEAQDDEQNEDDLKRKNKVVSIQNLIKNNRSRKGT